MKPAFHLSHYEPLYTRRDFLLRAGAGFGALALAYLLDGEKLLASPGAPAANPLAASPVAGPIECQAPFGADKSGLAGAPDNGQPSNAGSAASVPSM